MGKPRAWAVTILHMLCFLLEFLHEYVRETAGIAAVSMRLLYRGG